MPEREWWRQAAVYQVYLRSFADGDGDGVGDLAGLRKRLPHLVSLGVDAVWINPWYPSPMVDAGYDVSDYRSIHPAYGDLGQAQAFLDEAHAAGLRVLLDIVPNHTSTQHRWFQAALAGDRAARGRYVFRPGRGPAGAEPPNDWRSNFGGPAWTRVTEPDGTPGEWYLHMFAPEQADLNWDDPDVRAEFADVLRFWFDRGVDGFRIDVAHGLAKDPALPDAGPRPSLSQLAPHPAWDRDGVHEIYREWRAIADAYDPPRVFIAEAWVPSNDRLARYIRPDELHQAFQFDLVRAPWDARVMRDVIDDALATATAVGAPSTWVLSNHDVVRVVTRYARSQPAGLFDGLWGRDRWPTEAADVCLGIRRARAAALLALALPGSAYVYQGEELGLPEVEDIPADRRQDPTWERSGYADPGRDGCRVPLPWSGVQPPYGFSPVDTGSATWLPQPDSWADFTVAAQDGDPASVLHLYRKAIRLRARYWTDAPALQWVDGVPDRVLAFRRGDVQCWVNVAAREVELPPGDVILASQPVSRGRLLPDSAVWLTTRRSTGGAAPPAVPWTPPGDGRQR